MPCAALVLLIYDIPADVSELDPGYQGMILLLLKLRWIIEGLLIAYLLFDIDSCLRIG